MLSFRLDPETSGQGIGTHGTEHHRFLQDRREARNEGAVESAACRHFKNGSEDIAGIFRSSVRLPLPFSVTTI